MKHLSKAILAASLALISVISANAQYSITANNIEGEENEVVNLEINLNNGELQVTTLQFDLYLPEGVTIEKDADDAYIINPTSRKADHTFAAELQSDGAYRVLVYSSTNKVIKGEDGVLLTTPIKLGTAPGSYEVQIKDVELVNTEHQGFHPANTTATLTIKEAEVIRYGDNQLYVKDITINQGDNATMLIGYNSDSNVYEYTADIVLPEGVTVASVIFNPVVADVANYTNDWTFDAPTLKIHGKYGEGRKDVPSKGGDQIIANAVLNTSSLAPGTYTITVKNQYLDNDKTYNPEAYEAKITVKGSTLNTVALVDGTPYTNDTDQECETITYTRTFTTTNWQALYLPFDMSYNDWAALGDVAVLNDASNDGENATVSFTTVNSGTLSANTPCIFKPKAAEEVTFTVSDATLMAAPNPDPSISRPEANPFITIYGNYAERTGLAARGAFALSADGKFVKAASADQVLKPYRIYLLIDSSKKAPARISVTVDEETTGIDDIVILQQTDNRYFDLLGRPVENPQQGIYIQAGKKVIIK